jgi:hypothetical protein
MIEFVVFGLGVMLGIGIGFIIDWNAHHRGRHG